MNPNEKVLVDGLAACMSAADQKEAKPNTKAAFTLTAEQMSALHIFFENLVQWNEVMNLTAITEEGEVYVKHFLDSLTAVRLFHTVDVSRGTLIDVGTGAGFPGLVLAIAFPNLQVTLMDSLNKRIKFLEDTVNKIGLKNVNCVHARAEELARNAKYREQFDFAVSRAVANTSTLSEYCLPFVKVSGAFIAYKSEKAEEELVSGRKAIEILGGKLEVQDEFVLPGTEFNRTLLVIRKEKSTAKKYPRKAGTPSKEPLGK